MQNLGKESWQQLKARKLTNQLKRTQTNKNKREEREEKEEWTLFAAMNNYVNGHLSHTPTHTRTLTPELWSNTTACFSCTWTQALYLSLAPWHTCTRTHTHTNSHAHALTHTHALTHPHAHPHPLAHTHVRTHTTECNLKYLWFLTAAWRARSLVMLTLMLPMTQRSSVISTLSCRDVQEGCNRMKGSLTRFHHPIGGRKLWY